MNTRLSPLDKKLVRDLWHLRGQIAAISVVVLCGVATVVSMRASYQSLVRSQATYYADYRFADVFAQVKRAPESVVARLAAVPGVSGVETRIVMEVTLDVPGLAEPATGRLVSLPERDAPLLNAVHLSQGRGLEPGRRNEVLVSDAFADANHLRPGDTLGAVINGRRERLHIAGVALSPEYIYEIRASAVFPDSRRFGVLWLSREAMGPAFDMMGAFNDVALSLDRDANADDVIAGVDRLLARYGGLGAYGRDQHVSHRFISDEIKQTRVSGTVIPAIFLGIAAFLLNVVLSRLVATQREQIAVLKAFGYRNLTIGSHYVKLAIAGLLAGSAAGVGVGVWLASVFNGMYQQYYRFPEFQLALDANAIGLAILATGIAALAGAISAVRRAVTLPPAEAMRPEPPARFRPGLAERLGLRRWLSLSVRMILRSIERKPLKSALSVFGIALAVATLVVGRFFLDAIIHMADVQFRLVQRENLTVVFNQPRGPAATYALARMPGVLRAEPFRVVPVRMRFGHRERRIGLMGFDAGGDLHKLADRTRRIVPLPPDGIILTAKLAEVLGAVPGDTVAIEVLDGERRTSRIPIAGLVDEIVGLSGYMDAAALNRLLGEARVASGALLAVDPLAAPSIYGTLKTTPVVAGVTSRDATLASFHETLAQSIGMSMTMLITFAVAIAFAMVYNTARIALSERGRELASLRVLGFTLGEITFMLLGEQAWLTLTAIPLGLGLGYTIAAILSGVYQWELFRIPMVVSASTYGYAILVVLAAAAASGVVIRRRLHRLDLVAVLKTRE